ncbi:hypothetical protein TNCV_1942611 [Trichonephila clavipes]|nr:hypothetical protein TNCV_1942611 [Trichonephila clavipes]
MVEVQPINISLNQHSPGLSVRTAISPTLTEEIIIHPSVYSEIKKLGHAKSDVLLSESGSSLSADLGVVSVSNSALFSMKKKKKGIRTAADTVQSGWPVVASKKSSRSRHPAKRSLRAQAQLSETVTETFELVKVEPKL